MPSRLSRWCPGVLVALAGSSASMGAGPYANPTDLSTVPGLTPGVVFNGTAVADRAGQAVESVGDINGDGFDDLAIGAPEADPNGQSSAGITYIVFGKPGVTSYGSFNLSALNGTTGFAIRGIDLADFSGSSISSAGDLNNDGIDDIVIGAPFADPGGRVEAGECYVVFGKTNIGASGFINLSSLNGTTGFVINGVLAGDRVGEAVGGGADVNGDNIDDIVLGAPFADPNAQSAAGAVYIIFGASNVGASGSLNLSALNGVNGSVLNGLTAGDHAGSAIDVVPDVNGDGIGDVLVGVPDAYGNGADAGVVYLIFGGPGIGSGTNVSSPGPQGRCRIPGLGANDGLGEDLGSAGDVNGDGFLDLLAAAPGGGTRGETYILFGGPGFGAANEFDLASLDGVNGFVIRGDPALNDNSSDAASGAGDLNGDGFDDVLVAGHYIDTVGTFNGGVTYVVFGGPSVGSAGVFNISSLNGVNGFQIDGADSSDYSGFAVSSAGDINGDGVDDILIGAWFADPPGINQGGKAYVIFGKLGNTWISPNSGSWSTGSRWLAGTAPTAGTVIIDPMFGVTVTAPSSALFLDALTLGADFGRTTLDLGSSSLVAVDGPFVLGAGAALSGAGIFASSTELFCAGEITIEGMTLVAPDGVSIDVQATLTARDGFIAGSVSNDGLIDISPASPQTFGALEAGASLANTKSGLLLMRTGTVELTVDDEFINAGQMDIVLADATIFGDLTNEGTPTGGGFTPLGAVNIFEESFAMFVDDVINQSAIVLDADSSLAILGTLLGNGVSGPGGLGTAGAVFLGGGVSPGFSPGIAQFDGDATLGGNAITTIEIGGASPGTLHDKIVVAGTLSVGGTLRVVLINRYVPQPLDVYDVLDFGSLIGTFGAIELDPGLIAKNADISTLLIDGTIRIPAPSCPGDVNGDGDTNISDFNILAGNFGSTVTPNTGGDLTGDGFVNISDFNILAGDFGCGS